MVLAAAAAAPVATALVFCAALADGFLGLEALGCMRGGGLGYEDVNSSLL